MKAVDHGFKIENKLPRRKQVGVHPRLQNSKIRFFIPVFLSLLTFQGILSTSSARAAIITVSNLHDSGDGSLRQIVANANPGDTINFGVTGAITLTTGNIVIDKDLHISGPGASNLHISGNNNSRIFYINAGVSANISGLTIKNGKADDGGGIYNRGTLSITDCEIIDNNASSQGGAISNVSGDLTVNRCTISGNTSFSSGGAIAQHISGTVEVNNSTISGNTANTNGGGAFRHQEGILRISSCTITGNTANFSIADRGGGGIRTTGGTNPVIKNTIIAGNTVEGILPGPDCQGTIASGGFNFIGDDSDCSGTVGSDITGQDPLLNPLADNGGETRTHSTQITSLAIDGADPAGCSDADNNDLIIDQRGFSRSQNGCCDIGAYETGTAAGAIDLGDAPDPDYPTLLAEAGASHVLGSTRVFMGICADSEPDGQPNNDATGDDTSAGILTIGHCEQADDDEDGVTFATPLVTYASATVEVVANSPCYLSAWIDFDQSGDWDDTGERIFSGRALVGGANRLTFDVPGNATAGDTHSRFRCTTDGAVAFSGAATDGEVEDYPVTIEEGEPPPFFHVIIPTLTEWGQILLFLVLVVLGMWKMKGGKEEKAA